MGLFDVPNRHSHCCHVGSNHDLLDGIAAGTTGDGRATFQHCLLILWLSTCFSKIKADALLTAWLGSLNRMLFGLLLILFAGSCILRQVTHGRLVFQSFQDV